MNYKQRRPVLVYSDACGDGHFGCALYYGGEIFRVGPPPTPAVCLRQGEIAEYELAAGLLGLRAALSLFPGGPVLLGCDNQGANGAGARGPNKTRIGRSIASVFWHAAAEGGCAVWVEFARYP